MVLLVLFSLAFALPMFLSDRNWACVCAIIALLSQTQVEIHMLSTSPRGDTWPLLYFTSQVAKAYDMTQQQMAPSSLLSESPSDSLTIQCVRMLEQHLRLQ